MKIIKKSISVLSLGLLFGCSSTQLMTQSTHERNLAKLDLYPPPTNSFTQLLAPIKSQNAIKIVKIDGLCFRAMQKAIDAYNDHGWKNYQTFKDIVEDLDPPQMLNTDIPVVKLTCTYYDHDKIAVSMPTHPPSTLHVIFDKDLTILSWAFGDINRP